MPEYLNQSNTIKVQVIKNLNKILQVLPNHWDVFSPYFNAQIQAYTSLESKRDEIFNSIDWQN